MGQKFDTLQGVGTSTTQKQLLTSEVPEALSPSHYASLTMSKERHSFYKAHYLANIGLRPFYAKDTKENIPFLRRIQGDICGLIHPECGTIQSTLMDLVDDSTRRLHVVLLSTRSVAFVNLIAQTIHLRAHHLNYHISL